MYWNTESLVLKYHESDKQLNEKQTSQPNQAARKVLSVKRREWETYLTLSTL